MANEKKQKNQDTEAARRKKEEQSRRARRRNRQIIGLVLSILIIWGAVSIVRSGVQFARDLTDDTAERLAYQERIQLFVYFDVLPFENVSQLDDEVLKQLAIWGVYLEKGDELQKNEIDESLVPVVEVDRWAQNMFGPNFLYGEPHGEFVEASTNIPYQFDAEADAYILPATSQQYAYLPSVVAIERMSGGYRRVVVGYVSTTSDTGILYAEPDYEHPVRYMDFIFRRDGSEYYLSSLEQNTTWQVTAPETATSVAEETGPVAVPGEEDETGLPPEEEDMILQDEDEGAGAEDTGDEADSGDGGEENPDEADDESQNEEEQAE